MGGRVSWLLNVGYERQNRVGELGELRLIYVSWLATARTASDTLGLEQTKGMKGAAECSWMQSPERSI